MVFTPKGHAITLPKGATALDFAFAVDPAIGAHARYARINGRLSSIRTELKRGDCVGIGTDGAIHPREDWLEAVTTYDAKRQIRNYLSSLPSPGYTLCPHCHPMPGGEIIGFKDADGHVTIHGRNCPVAIRTASEKGNTIVAVNDFVADPDVLFPVRVEIVGIDRYHLLQDILDCIVERHHLSMSALSTRTRDNIVSCEIEFTVHDADELGQTLSGIRSIEGVEEVNVVSC